MIGNIKYILIGSLWNDWRLLRTANRVDDIETGTSEKYAIIETAGLAFYSQGTRR